MSCVCELCSQISLWMWLRFVTQQSKVLRRTSEWILWLVTWSLGKNVRNWKVNRSSLFSFAPGAPRVVIWPLLLINTPNTWKIWATRSRYWRLIVWFTVHFLFRNWHVYSDFREAGKELHILKRFSVRKCCLWESSKKASWKLPNRKPSKPNSPMCINYLVIS